MLCIAKFCLGGRVTFILPETVDNQGGNPGHRESVNSFIDNTVALIKRCGMRTRLSRKKGCKLRNLWMFTLLHVWICTGQLSTSVQNVQDSTSSNNRPGENPDAFFRDATGQNIASPTMYQYLKKCRDTIEGIEKRKVRIISLMNRSGLISQL